MDVSKPTSLSTSCEFQYDQKAEKIVDNPVTLLL
jgi:hypothetical protein